MVLRGNAMESVGLMRRFKAARCYAKANREIAVSHLYRKYPICIRTEKEFKAGLRPLQNAGEKPNCNQCIHVYRIKHMVFRKVTELTEVQAAESFTQTESESVYLGRQPILDRNGALIAFELLFRDSTENRAHVSDDQLATAQVVVRTIGEVGMTAALGPHTGYLNVNGAVLASDMILLVPPHRFVLEILETVTLDATILQRCAKLRHHGFKLALDDVAGISERLRDALPVVDIVKVDFMQCARDALPELVALVKQHDKVLLAEKVEIHDDFQCALDLGFDLFQGYYFAKPQILRSRRPSTSNHALLRLLSLLAQEPTITELESELKFHPNLVMQLLRLINSSAFGPSRPISSLRQAIIAAGTRRITHWAQLLLFADGRNLPLQSDPLIQLTGSRARFMELAATTLHPHKGELADAAFMTGVFSLVHLVFGSTVEEVFEMVPLSLPIRAAILEEKGELGLLLALAQACEHGDEAEMTGISEALWKTASSNSAQFSVPAVADLGLQAAQWITRHARS